MNWHKLDVYQFLKELQDLVGGEYAFDTIAQQIFHDETQGQDLTEAGVLWLREGHNLGNLVPETIVGEVKNRLYYEGYGDDMFRISVMADATGTNDDGDTSRDLYGVQRFTYRNPDTRDLASAWAEALRLVEKEKFPLSTWRTPVEDTVAALIVPGDSVRVTHQLIGTKTLRVLEIIRRSDGSEASLLLGERAVAMDSAAQRAALRRTVDRLLRG